MGSVFDQKWLAARPKLDALMAEYILVTFMTRGEFASATPNAAVPAFMAVGTMIVASQQGTTPGGGQALGMSDKGDLIMVSPQATFLPDQFNTSNRPVPVAGTRLTRVTQPNQPSYALISDALPDSVGELICRLSPVLSAT